MQCSYNRLIITVDAQFDDVIKLANGKKLYIDTRFNPEEKVALTGTVHSVPKGMKDVPGAEGLDFGPIKAGDTVMLRYDVLSTTRDQPDRDSVRYRNEVWIDGKQYWFADVEQVFGVFRDGEWVMINDNVLMEKQILSLSENYTPRIIRPVAYREKPTNHLGCIVSPGNSGLQIGDYVIFVSNFAQKYVLGGKPVILIRDRYICAVTGKVA